MKHVIVFETSDDGRSLSETDQSVLVRTIELWLEIEGRVGWAQGKFNVPSAIAAIHEMYGAPKYDPENPSPQVCGTTNGANSCFRCNLPKGHASDHQDVSLSGNGGAVGWANHRTK